MRKRIYILRQCMADNIVDKPWPYSKMKPVTVVDFPDNPELEPVACHEVQINGPSRLVYDPGAPKALPGHPLDLIEKGISPQGTKVWLETKSTLTVTTWGKGVSTLVP